MSNQIILTRRNEKQKPYNKYFINFSIFYLLTLKLLFIMKTIKFFATLAIVLGFAVGAMAQVDGSDNDVISGKALVLQQIDVTGITDLDFGWVAPGLAKTIDLENVPTGGQSGFGTESTGVFSVSAAAGSNVQIQYTTLPDNLMDELVSLPIGSYTAGYHSADVFAAGTTFDAGTGTQVNAGVFPTNVVGDVNLIYVFLGGTVTPASDQAAGSYVAEITLTATYN
jgi:hypothetical protein